MNENHKPFLSNVEDGLFTSYLLAQMPDIDPIKGLRHLIEEASAKLSKVSQEDCESTLYPALADSECAC